MRSRFQVLSLLLFSLAASLPAETAFRSGPAQVTLLELYSSEGCSSCPPADAWFGRLREDRGLWRRFVPVAFQVDYWNYLGWPDPLSRGDFTRRQQAYGAELGGGVYTPEFIRNGVEQGSRIANPEAAGLNSGVLEVKREGQTYRVRFAPGIAGEHWRVQAALLGNGIERAIASGENGGRKLRHEFVALSFTEGELKKEKGAFTAELRFPPAAGTAPRHSVAFWVTPVGSLKPVQATGGDLD